MNNKGFTLIELLAVISIIALILIIIIVVSGNTLSVSNEEAYKITKKGIIKATDKYILECDNDLIYCDLDWNNNKTVVMAYQLIEVGYFKEIINPLNNKDLKDCLFIEVEKVNDNYKYNINDNDC